MKTKTKQIYCKHWKKESLVNSIYIYKLISCELHLCIRCEKKLRKQIFEQDKIEKESNIIFNKKFYKKYKDNKKLKSQ